jgi:hypothetical protein|tara:strand:- start:364 stop:591 length:228 start_codon:yes stop_codon:yes gene_type:complete
MISFDGTKKIIKVTDTHTIQITDIYSSWKRWVISDNNLKYKPAFNVINNEEQIYVINDEWKIKGIDRKNIKGRFL